MYHPLCLGKIANVKSHKVQRSAGHYVNNFITKRGSLLTNSFSRLMSMKTIKMNSFCVNKNNNNHRICKPSLQFIQLRAPSHPTHNNESTTFFSFASNNRQSLRLFSTIEKENQAKFNSEQNTEKTAQNIAPHKTIMNDEGIKVEGPPLSLKHKLILGLKKYFLHLVIIWLLLFIMIILISLEYNKTIKVVAIGTNRFLNSLVAGLQISFDYKYSLYNLDKDSVIYQEELKKAHERSAKRLLKLFQQNKGIFIKFGQHLSALDYLLPPEYTSIMRVLQDHAPTTTYQDIESVFLQEFHKTPDQIFELFDKNPIAAASLAQVHIAILDGQKVAVKVQFPGLQENCEGDSWTIGTLLRMAEAIFPDFKLSWLIKEININLPLELDFFHEARNAEKLRKNFKHSPTVKVPDIIWPYSTSKILVMEFCEGVHVDDLKGIKEYGISVKDLATTVTNTFNKMIFEDGFVHCDPHPGNMLVRPFPESNSLFTQIKRFILKNILHIPTPLQVVILDHGLYRNLNEDNFRIDYLHLWDSLINFNERKIEFYSKKLGAPGYEVFCSMLTLKPWENISITSVAELNDSITDKEKEIILKAAQSKLKDITLTLSSVKSELLLLFKTNDLLRLINRSLGNPINSYIVTSKFVKDLLGKMSLEKDPSFWNKTMVTVSNIFFDFKLFLLNFWSPKILVSNK